MKILVVGSGGREHAIIWKLSQNPKVKKIYCAPGNTGISLMAENVDIHAEDVEGLLIFARVNNIDLTVVGPEGSLVKGIVDRFQQEGLRIFGPNKKCAQLEGSKAFAKDFMLRHHIPTARYQEYTDVEQAKKAVGMYGYPMVIKADGLAAGKGVIIAQDESEALESLNSIMVKKQFGEAGNKVVIEEFLTGTETSILCFVDGKNIIPMVSAQDYKKIYDNDEGPNTGGMGTYSPSHIYNEALEKEVEEKILQPVLNGLQTDDLDFKGILFIGLMITSTGAKVLEFNTRFGDPETQVILTRLDTDLLEIIDSILEQRLENQIIQWKKIKTVCIVLASGGYPGSYEKDKKIEGLDTQEADTFVFHAGTRFKGNDVVTYGGRVLGVAAWGSDLEEARGKAYGKINSIRFEGMQYRQDIGKVK